jgi:phosphonate transport system substrate-binding protein
MRTRRPRRCATALLAALLAVAPAMADVAGELAFGVFPFVSSRSLEAVFAPIAAEMARVLERPVRLRSAGSYAEFSQALANGAFDLAFVQPFDYVRWAAPRGYLPLARLEAGLEAVIVAREASALEGIQALRGHRLGLPPADSAVSLLTRRMLADAGLGPRDVELHYLSSHSECLQELVASRFDACATARTPARHAEGELDVTLREIAVSPRIPGPLFVAHPRLAPPARDRVRELLLREPLPAEARAFFAADTGPLLTAASDADYDPVRSLWRALGRAPEAAD